jgi:hypothetical protein
MIKTVATTIADSVRLAVREGNGDYWFLRLEEGALERAQTNNRLTGNYGVKVNDWITMKLGCKYGKTMVPS